MFGGLRLTENVGVNVFSERRKKFEKIILKMNDYKKVEKQGRLLEGGGGMKEDRWRSKNGRRKMEMDGDG